MISKKDVSKALALSCVESYFLAWLKEYYAVERLYGSSFISIKKVFDDFAHGMLFENYTSVPRLQTVAEDYGIVTHEFINCSYQKAIDIIKNQPDNSLCLIRVNNSFFSKHKRTSWREDHYVCVDNQLNWINHYPLSEGVFSEYELSTIYDNAVCIYKLKDSLTVLPDKINLQKFYEDKSVKFFPNTMLDFESAIGVLRILRRRLLEFFAEKIKVVSLIKEEIKILDKIYFDVHLFRLKKMEKYDPYKFKDEIKILTEIEEKIFEEIRLYDEYY